MILCVPYTQFGGYSNASYTNVLIFFFFNPKFIPLASGLNKNKNRISYKYDISLKYSKQILHNRPARALHTCTHTHTHTRETQKLIHVVAANDFHLARRRRSFKNIVSRNKCAAIIVRQNIVSISYCITNYYIILLYYALRSLRAY